MSELNLLTTHLAWPFALALAWIAGEFGHRWTGLPRISFYGLVGFLLAHSQLGLLPPDTGLGLGFLADIAFGLILFEMGYRINLNWLRTNPWVPASGVAEALLTFLVVFIVARWFDTPVMASLLLASLAMSTSPAGILRVINEEGSSGQVSERVLHLSAMNCVLAVFAFKLIVGIGVFQVSGQFLDAAWNGLIVVLVSILLGGILGVLMPALLRQFGNLGRDATLGFAIGVIVLVAVANAYRLSPVLATLTFGLVARHRRIALSQAQRNFGAMGDLLSVWLFFYVATTLQWNSVMGGLGLALALIIARMFTKIIAVTAFSHVSGISTRKGVLTGLALTPLSVFVILMLEQTRHIGLDFVDTLLPLAAMVLLLQVLGPIATQFALVWANETPEKSEK